MNQNHVNEYVRLIEEQLSKLVPEENIMQENVIKAMRYSLFAGGKRIRPILLLEFCRICHGNVNAALPFACAVEMVHTYSLIHDDLPCMDNDDMRRGRPSNHKVFGEDTALLAGDALLTMAFDVMLSEESVKNVGTKRASKASWILAKAAGVHGMVGGQVIDLMSEGNNISIDTLKKMDQYKTGALISAAVSMGCVLGGANDEQLKSAEKYAQCIGLSFQIVDDILDVVSNTEMLGKPVGSDSQNNKCTYVSLMGLEKARETVKKLTENAIYAIKGFGENAEYLINLAKKLASRQS